jgi:hypothetical protein
VEWSASLGQAPALLTNIRLGLIGLPRTNTQAYYKNSEITAVKSFITLGLGQRLPYPLLKVRKAAPKGSFTRPISEADFVLCFCVCF